MNITNDYDSSTNCTDNENDDINIIVKYLLSISGSVLLVSLIGFIIYTMMKTLISGYFCIPNSSSSLEYYDQVNVKKLFSNKFNFKYY